MTGAFLVEEGKYHLLNHRSLRSSGPDLDTSTPISRAPATSANQLDEEDRLAVDFHEDMNSLPQTASERYTSAPLLPQKHKLPLHLSGVRENIHNYDDSDTYAALKTQGLKKIKSLSRKTSRKTDRREDGIISTEGALSQFFTANVWKLYTFSIYFNLLTNLLTVAVAGYLVFVIITTLREDIQLKVDGCISDALNEISACSKKFYMNKCLDDENNKRAPALELTCLEWEQCMNRDPQQLAKSRITAEILAEVLNSFFNNLSWKSLFLLLCFLFGSAIVTLLSFERLKQLSATTEKNLKIRVKTLENELHNFQRGSSSYEDILPSILLPTDQGSFDRRASLDTSALPFSSPLTNKASKRKNYI